MNVFSVILFKCSRPREQQQPPLTSPVIDIATRSVPDRRHLLPFVNQVRGLPDKSERRIHLGRLAISLPVKLCHACRSRESSPRLTTPLCPCDLHTPERTHQHVKSRFNESRPITVRRELFHGCLPLRSATFSTLHPIYSAFYTIVIRYFAPISFGILRPCHLRKPSADDPNRAADRLDAHPARRFVTPAKRQPPACACLVRPVEHVRHVA